MSVNLLQSGKVISVLRLPPLEQLVALAPDTEVLKFASKKHLTGIDPGVEPLQSLNGLFLHLVR